MAVLARQMATAPRTIPIFKRIMMSSGDDVDHNVYWPATIPMTVAGSQIFISFRVPVTSLKTATSSGDRVNFAAWLEGLVEAGGICVSGCVHMTWSVWLTPLATISAPSNRKISCARCEPLPLGSGLVPAAVTTPSIPFLALHDKPSIAVTRFKNSLVISGLCLATGETA